jgi:hypothetical protein
MRGHHPTKDVARVATAVRVKDGSAAARVQ